MITILARLNDDLFQHLTFNNNNDFVTWANINAKNCKWYKTYDENGKLLGEYTAPKVQIVKFPIEIETYSGIKQYGIRRNGKFIGLYRVHAMVGFLYFNFKTSTKITLKSTNPCMLECIDGKEVPMKAIEAVFYMEE